MNQLPHTHELRTSSPTHSRWLRGKGGEEYFFLIPHLFHYVADKRWVQTSHKPLQCPITCKSINRVKFSLLPR